MKILKLHRLAISNFKGLRKVEATFSDGITTISGHNGVGKSTIADAFAWLLFGKNAAGATDQRFTIKTVTEDGAYIPDLNHEVEGDFTMTDDTTGAEDHFKLRRAFVEEWRTTPGETERVLRGHHTDYYYNDVIIKKSDYDNHVAELINPGIFKVITDPYAFMALPWDEQRNRLTQITGEVKPEDIAATNPAFAALMQRYKGATLEDYRQTLGAQIKRITDEMEKIPTRIDEVTRNTPITPNYAELEQQKTDTEAKLADLEAAARSEADANRQHYESLNRIQASIDQERQAQQQIIYKATEQEQQRCHEANAGRITAEAKLRDLRTGLQLAEASYNRYLGARRQIAAMLEPIDDDTEAKSQKMRQEFEAISLTHYDPSALICPRYNHVCNDPIACSKGESEYNVSRVAALNKIRDNAHKMKAAAQQQKQDLLKQQTENEARITEAEAQVNQYKQQVSAAEQALAAMPPLQSPTAIKGSDLPAWQAAQAKIDALELEKNADNAVTTGNNNAQTRAALKERLAEINRRLGLRTTIEASARRIKELNDQTATLAQEKANKQKELALAEDFNLAIIDAVEQKVNAYFGYVKFRMFKTLVNGTRQPDCVATVNGVVYQDINTAAKINAGMDVINTFARYYGMAAPIFVDNCESIAELRAVPFAQIIRIQFVKDQPLTITPQG